MVNWSAGASGPWMLRVSRCLKGLMTGMMVILRLFRWHCRMCCLIMEFRATWIWTLGYFNWSSYRHWWAVWMLSKFACPLQRLATLVSAEAVVRSRWIIDSLWFFLGWLIFLLFNKARRIHFSFEFIKLLDFFKFLNI